jgi:hypothetical protein
MDDIQVAYRGGGLEGYPDTVEAFSTSVYRVFGCLGTLYFAERGETWCRVPLLYLQVFLTDFESIEWIAMNAYYRQPGK